MNTTPNSNPPTAEVAAAAGGEVSTDTSGGVGGVTPPNESQDQGENLDTPLFGGEQPPSPAFDIATYKFPDNLEFTDDQRTELSNLATSHKLSEAAVGEMLGMYTKQMEAAEAAKLESWQKTITDWRAEIREHYKDGGPDTALTKANRVINEFGSEELRTFLKLSGGGDNLAVLRMLEKVADAIGEGKPLTAQGNPSQQQRQQVRYPSMVSKE